MGYRRRGVGFGVSGVGIHFWEWLSDLRIFVFFFLGVGEGRGGVEVIGSRTAKRKRTRETWHILRTKDQLGIGMELGWIKWLLFFFFFFLKKKKEKKQNPLTFMFT